MQRGQYFGQILLRLQAADGVELRLQRGQTPQTGGIALSSEKVRQDRLVASAIYRFGKDDDPFKRAFRFLFGGPKEEGN